MSLILLILLALVLIIFTAIIIILYIGFTVSAKAKLESFETAVEIDVKWLNFTLYHKDFPENKTKQTKKDDGKTKDKKEETDEEDEEEKTVSEKIDDLKYKYQCKIKPLIPYIKEAWDPFIDFLISSSKSFKLNLLYLKLLIGFEETSATALFVGYVWAFASILNIAPMVDISAIPDFENEIMDIYGRIIIEIYPLKAIRASIALLTKKSVLKLIFKVIKVFM